jgi:putative transcription antitermination factor YqgF
MLNKLPRVGKILALDIGRRHTGIAITDATQKAVFLREEFSHKSQIELMERLRVFFADESVVGVLAGWPLDMSGAKTDETLLVEEVIEKIRALDVPVVLMDERWTSKQAEKNQGSHSEAALILLNTYLDSLLP